MMGKCFHERWSMGGVAKTGPQKNLSSQKRDPRAEPVILPVMEEYNRYNIEMHVLQGIWKNTQMFDWARPELLTKLIHGLRGIAQFGIRKNAISSQSWKKLHIVRVDIFQNLGHFGSEITHICNDFFWLFWWYLSLRGTWWGLEQNIFMRVSKA